MGGSESTMTAADALKDPEMVSKKVDELKNQGKILSNALFKHMDKMGVECQKALDASNNDSHVAAVVAFKLESFSELLGNAMAKLQATDQAEAGAGSSATQFKMDEQMVSSVLERIEKFEESNAKLEKMCAENQATHAQSNSVKLLEQEIHQLRSRMDKADLQTDKLQTEMANAQESSSDMERRLETVTTEVKACNSDSDELKEKMKNLHSLVIDTAGLGSQFKKMKSKHKALKKEIVKVKEAKEKDGTASLLLARRVSNLEKLRKILNGNQSKAGEKTPLRKMCEDTEKQLQTVSSNAQVALFQAQNVSAEVQNVLAEIQDVSGEVHDLGTDIARVRRPAVGFSAQFDEDYRTLNSNSHIKKLFHVITNIGGCFMPNQGRFCTPQDGLYCFSVTLSQQYRQHFSAHLVSKKDYEGAKQRYEIVMNDYFPHSASCVLYLSGGEQVFLKIGHSDGPIQLNDTFTFSGWSVGYE